MKPFALTKDEFITRSMAGEVFISNHNKFFYDTKSINPFRIDKRGLIVLGTYLMVKAKYSL